MIVASAERLLAEDDPLLVTFDQVAKAAGVSRASVHAYLGDRRGLVDAVQLAVIRRLDTWVSHGLSRATTAAGALNALVHGVLAFVEAESDGWSVLTTTGGSDHPAFHQLRRRWAGALEPGAPEGDPGPAATAVVGALVLNAPVWIARRTEADEVLAVLGRLLHPSG